MRDLVKVNYDKNNPKAVVWIVKEEWDLYHKWKKEQESKLPNWGKLIYGTK